MRFHGLLGDHRPGRDLGVGQALGDQAEYLGLARRERSQLGRGGLAAWAAAALLAGGLLLRLRDA